MDVIRKKPSKCAVLKWERNEKADGFLNKLVVHPEFYDIFIHARYEDGSKVLLGHLSKPKDYVTMKAGLYFVMDNPGGGIAVCSEEDFPKYYTVVSE